MYQIYSLGRIIFLESLLSEPDKVRLHKIASLSVRLVTGCASKEAHSIETWGTDSLIRQLYYEDRPRGCYQRQKVN